MRFAVFFFLCLILSSCQAALPNWLSNLKDNTLTRVASQVTDDSLTPDDKEDILDLFFDIRKASHCSQVQISIEDNRFLRLFEKEFDLKRGFIFDVFLDYDYEKSLLKINRSREENIAFTVVSVWKTKFSLETIQEMIIKIRKCYPYKY